MIRAHELTKSFSAGVPVVDRVSFELERGSLLVLVGGSGSGKTTTLKMLNRLLEPSSGTIHFDGIDVRSLPEHVLRRRVGYVFQKIGLFPHLTIAQNIGITPSLLGWSAARIASRVDELLALVELDPELKPRLPGTLSGGQQQRVAVARALAAEPELLLLDEPFGALDPLTRDLLQRSFQEIRRSLGITAVLVTHDMVEAFLLADRIGVMHSGRLEQLASPDVLISRPATAYVEQLLDSPRRQARALAALSERSARA